MGKTVITPEMAAYISSNYLKQSGTSMAVRFGVSKCAVQRFMRMNGIKVPFSLVLKFRSEAMKGRTRFTESEDEFIRENYLKMPVKAIGERIGRSFTGIMSRLDAMGLDIPRELRDQRKRANQIKPGNISFNKGKKQADYMTDEAIERTAKTRFRKGQLPHNAAPRDGEVRIRDVNRRPYKFIRISLAKWVLLHKHLWEQINGPVPAGHCLRARDGDSLNADPSNWELITRRENHIRNSGTVSLTDQMVAFYLSPRDRELREQIKRHPELIKTKRGQLLLNRKINETKSI